MSILYAKVDSYPKILFFSRLIASALDSFYFIVDENNKINQTFYKIFLLFSNSSLIASKMAHYQNSIYFQIACD